MTHLTAAAALAAFTAGSLADTIYEQPPVPPDQVGWSGYSSQWTDNTPGQTITADAFELTSSATITGVHFWGKYVWAGQPSPAAYRVTLFRSDGPPSANGVTPAPGSILAAFSLSTLDPGFHHTPAQTFTGHDLYEATLPSPLVLTANTRYWISIAGIGPADGLPWAWSQSMVNSVGQGEYNVFSTDSWWIYGPAPNITGRAWGLTGIPAPGSLIPLVAAALAPRRRRRLL